MLETGEAREALRQRGISWSFHCIEGRLVHADGIDRGMGAELLVFLSRHTSARPAPLLTVHATGNFSRAELGGTPFHLPPAAPVAMKAVLLALHRHAPPGYRVSYEATHHGPTELETPSFFLEIGSTGKEWEDPAAGEAVASGMMEGMEAPVGGEIPLLGLGGDHYATRATKIALASRAAFGHIVPSREIAHLEGDLLRQLLARGAASGAYLDRHSIPDREVKRLERELEALRVPVVGERELQGLGELGWEAYLKIRSMAREIEPAAQVVVGRLSGDGEPVVAGVPVELLREALRADADAVCRGLGELPLCGLRGRSGGLLPLFITFEKWRSEAINDLIRLCIQTIIGRRETLIHGDNLVIQDVCFDPEKARRMGIPAGPLYKELAEGRAVKVDGRTITPEMVQTRSQKILCIPELERFR